MRKSIRLHEAAEWIENSRDFYVRASKNVQKELGMFSSFEGWNIPDSAFRSMPHIPRGQMPQNAYRDMREAMERRGVSYVVLSYGTVIGWQDRAGGWHLLPHRYSLTTTQHQWTLWHVAGQGTGTDRVVMDDDVKIGRPGW